VKLDISDNTKKSSSHSISMAAPIHDAATVSSP